MFKKFFIIHVSVRTVLLLSAARRNLIVLQLVMFWINFGEDKHNDALDSHAMCQHGQ